MNWGKWGANTKKGKGRRAGVDEREKTHSTGSRGKADSLKRSASDV